MDWSWPNCALDVSSCSHSVTLILLAIPVELLHEFLTHIIHKYNQMVAFCQDIWVALYIAIVPGPVHSYMILWLPVTVSVSPSSFWAPESRYWIFFLFFLLLFFSRSSTECQVLCQMFYVNCCLWPSQQLLHLYSTDKQNESLRG